MMTRPKKNRFAERLQQNEAKLQALYDELYHDEQAYAYFLSMLEKMYDQRSEALKKWDDLRSKDQDWYRDNDILGTSMYVDCFASDLPGLMEHLDYLEETGINYLHLMPLLESPQEASDGGYAVADYRKVDPRLGTMADLARLADECHNRKMVICLDFVLNHTSEDHEWAQRAKKGEKEYQDRYYFYDNWDIPNQYEMRVPQVFPVSAPGNFSWCEEAKKVVMTTFYPYQWDLNYHNPTVLNDMCENMLYLCNQGIDIIRLDATPYLWKQLGTSCRNLPEVHKLVRLLRLASQIVCPSVLLLGEVVMEPAKVVPYFGTLERPECHLLYNVTTMASTWHTVATRDVRLLRDQLEKVFALPKDYTFLNYLRCHDDISWDLDYEFLKQFGIEEAAHKRFLNSYLMGHEWGSQSRGELYNDDPRFGDARLCGTTASLCGLEAGIYEQNEWKSDHAVRLILMLHAFLFCLSGIPILYEGDEIGQLNDYSYHNDPRKQNDSRYLHRGRLEWHIAERRHDPDLPQAQIYQGIRKLRRLRAEHPLFKAEADTWIIETYNDHVLGIGRYGDQEKLLAFFNFSENDQTAWIDEKEEYRDLLSGRRRTARAPGIPGHDFLWLYHDYKAEK